MTRSWLVALPLVSGIVLASAPSYADTPDKDAEAERLFREGQRLMEQKRLGEACPKFEAAYKKDQQLGTLLNLAYCHKQQGAIWQAWTEFKEAEVKAVSLKLKDRRDFARKGMTELEKQLAKVIVDPTSKVELTEVLIEDRRVWDAEKSVTIAVEPGPERKFTFLAKGKKPLVQTVPVPAAKRGDAPLHITVGEMEDEPPPAPVVEAPVVVAPPRSPKAERPPPRDEHAGAWRTAAWITVGVGVPVLAVGSVLGVMTLGSDCIASKRTPTTCDSTERAGSSTIAALSTVGIIGGAALTATGLGIFLFGPKPSSSSSRAWLTPDLGPGWAGVHGAF